MPSEAQKKFIATFTEEFFREIQFMIDTKSGRANKRKTFFEKLIGKIDNINEVVNIFVTFFPVLPVIKAGVSTVQKTVGGVLKICKFIVEKDVDTNVDAIVSGAHTPELILKLTLEKAAMQLARRHEFFINHLCAPESIELFAVVGVARVLRYLSDTKGVEFTIDTILKGAIQGRSGSGQQGFKNNKLKIKDRARKVVDAETVYGRSAHMDLSGDRYFDQDPPRVTFRTTYGYVEKENDLPIAGVMVLHDPELEEYRFEEKPISQELAAHINHYRPRFRYIGREEVNFYLREIRERGESKSLTEFYEVDEILCRGDFSEMDLSQGNFTEVTFVECDLSRARLEGTNFENAHMVGVNLAQASGRANFRGANLSLVNATEADLAHSNFMGVRLWHASLKGAKLQGIHYLGVDCYGADFSGVDMEENQYHELLVLKETTQELLLQQRFQAGRIQALENTQETQGQHIQNLEMHCQLLESAQRENRFELELATNRLLELQEDLRTHATDASFMESLHTQIVSLERDIREAEQARHAQAAQINVTHRDHRLALDFARRKLAELEAEREKYAEVSFVKSLQAQISSVEEDIQEYYREADILKADFRIMTEKLTRMDRVLATHSNRQDSIEVRVLAVEELSRRHDDFIREIMISNGLRVRVGDLEERVASHTHETSHHLRVHEQRLQALEQRPVSVTAVTVFAEASASASRARETGIHSDLQRVFDILREYPPFPGVHFSIKNKALHCQVPDEKDYLTVRRFLRKWNMLKFSELKVQIKGRPYVNLLLEEYDLTELDRRKQELPGLLTWIRTQRVRSNEEYEADIIGYTRAIQQNALDMDARRHRASAYSHLGQYDNAISDYTVILEHQPRERRLYYNRGVCFAKLDDHDQALKDFNAALSISPNMAEALFERGRSLYELGQYDEALRSFNLLLHKSADHLDASFHQGLCFQKLGEQARAERLQQDYLQKAESVFLEVVRKEKLQAAPRRDLIEACELALVEIEAYKKVSLPASEHPEEDFRYSDAASSAGSDATFLARYQP